MVVVGFTGLREENPQGFFPGLRYMLEVVVLHLNVLQVVLSTFFENFPAKISNLPGLGLKSQSWRQDPY